jgi:hypothetical protein
MPAERHWWKLVVSTVLVLVLIFLFAVCGMRPTADFAESLHGVPGSDQPNRQSFEDSFWSAIYSGVPVGAVTGIVIGLFLLYAEHRMDERRTREHLRENLDAFRGSIWAIAGLTDSTPYFPESATAAVPIAAPLIVQASQDKPLSIWRNRFGDDSGFLVNLDEVIAGNTAFSVVARLTDEGLRFGIRDYLAENGWDRDEQIENEIFRYCLAVFLRDDRERAGRMIAHALTADELEAACDYLMQHPQYQSIQRDFLMSIDRLRASIESLEKAAAIMRL